MTVGIVDYGLGNLGSVRNMLKRVGAQSVSVRTADEIAEVDKVLLPGVGAFDTGVTRLAEAGLIDALRDFAGTGRPLLGICLGMQLLLDGSDEGVKSGLGLIPGRSVRFDEKLGIRVPHMGWNLANPTREDPLVAELPEESRFYFVHSYHVVPERAEDTLAITDYGIPFSSMVRTGNVMGAQFHPEKSHTFGMTIMRNFAAL
ncbi:imidazole glycerol phosphate synthase subunit HisH [Microbacterium arabinogalactanolyticum]|uniref:imidazole glycerol phosphate synthase subunit HisH n=1 Tax=Microbacterium arabinogalactanolyticum TaxID=69365 RepID=UPI002556BF6A|nr:imidazole glycerol phosphate synthase subunit HisH [Microbacterium arabinogalactanolyticum]GLC84922.1 imidazole glycerol phosphate synthase subunit HisH 2 [Microbacterium arabinogalactanolyticum]